MFEIRYATPDDIDLIRELTLQVWPQTYSSIISKEQIDYMLEMMYSKSSLSKQMTEEGCQFVIIYENNKAAGFASFSEIENKIWKLHKIYVLLNQQGKGTGRFLLNYILEIIKSKKGASLRLQVNRHNNAKGFYEKLGFTILEEADFEIGGGYFMNDYVMEKIL